MAEERNTTLGLDDFEVIEGATAIHASTIENQLLQHAQEDGATTFELCSTDIESLQEQLWAVHRELRTVQKAVDHMQTPPSTNAPINRSDAPVAEPDTTTNIQLAQGELQRAIMQQRLGDLQSQKHQLMQKLSSAGFAATQFLDSTEDAAAVAFQEAIINDSKSNKKKGKKKVQFQELEEEDLFDAADAFASKNTSLIETERDRLIRLGILTPFDRLGGFERRIEKGLPQHEDAVASIARVGEKVRSLKASKRTSKLVDISELPRPQRPVKRIEEHFWRSSSARGSSGISTAGPVKRVRRQSTLPRLTKKLKNNDSSNRDAAHAAGDEEKEEICELDDCDAMVNEEMSDGNDDDGNDDDDEEEEEEQDGTVPGGKHQLQEQQQPEDVIFEGGYRIPGDVYAKLFDYQRTGIKWLWELHTQRAGGIIGDEMGLGKTIQIVAFLAGLHHSGLFEPSLIVCPATVLTQWLREIRSWYPSFRVAILHDSLGQTHNGSSNSTRNGTGRGAHRISRTEIIQNIASSSNGILLTTYDQLRLRRGELLRVRWGYAILDEGHKIRNPDAEVTLSAKQLPTLHRLIMSGSPIQNKLTELWSLFDFVFPGKLGTLPVFQAQFAIPIQVGGYANASPLQVSAAYKCAVMLRDLIAPYLLRRRKADVASSLPKKTEQVLFCTLSQEQRDMYRSYLASQELSDILSGNAAALAGIDILRKICNHPDLLERSRWDATAEYGATKRSGKLVVLEKVLCHWKEGGHKYVATTHNCLPV